MHHAWYASTVAISTTMAAQSKTGLCYLTDDLWRVIRQGETRRNGSQLHRLSSPTTLSRDPYRYFEKPGAHACMLCVQGLRSFVYVWLIGIGISRSARSMRPYSDLANLLLSVAAVVEPNKTRIYGDSVDKGTDPEL